MGIRYYAYAFDPQLTEQAVTDPFSVIAADPLADAWGLEPGFTVGTTDGKPSLPERELLYLDKAWSFLQRLTAPSFDEPPRPAYRMFEGRVREVLTPPDYGYEPWGRAITPDEVWAIAGDLDAISDDEIAESVRIWSRDEKQAEADVPYVTHFFHRAEKFVQSIARDGRGFAYTIG